MPGQQQRRGEASGPPLSQEVSSSSQPQAQAPVQFIETLNPNLQPPPSSAQTPLFRVPQSPRSPAAGESSSKVAKIAIPRLERSIDAAGEDATKPGGRHRVSHACEPCRQRKTKCSGERPVCRHCQDFKITCFYAGGKRDRVKKQGYYIFS
ncbi:uncharacterized protein Z518_04201 [Rhinocladiella mackenziei CBS 650.93]|uniref:Zn(2)-C6 fungal-type domain-containing protein n=1 Tax=Rhinocladiella mackenziei CBS 650.93 TaxID=1442369 RepID=A0A0D2ISS0_9EURO|nr:uncharacterized protein Z518_04201 [Rhinocladiella mackenziei CBS 650.93]KIX06226.1 hypothetical protein Z518_04201 [Rhinocladiella mackenziei CBS 650.93]